MNIELAGHYTHRRIIRSVLPSIGMVLVTSIYSIVDGFFVANFAGKTGFAAVNLTFPAIMMIGSLGLMIGTGGAALVAKIKGESNPQKANRVFTMLVQFGLVLGLTLGGVLAMAAPTVARWLGADEPMMAECVTYIRLNMIGMPGFVLQCAFQSFYMAAERPQLGTLMSVVAGVVNIVLDTVLVWALGLGVAGAAIATAAGCTVGGLFPLFYFSSRRNRGTLRIIPTRILWPYIGKACSNGLSEYVGSIAMNIVTICYNLQLMRYLGEDGVSAYGVVMYIAFIFAAVFIGYNIGITPIIGYHYGARDVREQRSLFYKSLTLIGVLGVLMALSAELFAGPLARVFVGYDEALTALTIRAMRLYMLAFLISGINMFVSALFTGLNNGAVSAVASFMRTLVFELVCVWLLPALVGIDGIWVAWPIAEVLALFLCATLILCFAPQLFSVPTASRSRRRCRRQW
ncbi:MAG: MATE family efflux transporter [Bacteroidales bacterium]|nr:MATE family efflux transporter [Bacteroidales bacterium]